MRRRKEYKDKNGRYLNICINCEHMIFRTPNSAYCRITSNTPRKDKPACYGYELRKDLK